MYDYNKDEKRNTVVLDGLTFNKGIRLWEVTTTRCQSSKRKISNFHFSDSDSAKALWEAKWKEFEEENPEACLRKNEYTENKFGDITKANRTYVIGDNEYNRMTFYLKMVRVLELDSTSTDEEEENYYDEQNDGDSYEECTII